MKLRELIKGLDIIEVRGNLDIEIGHIAYDSRKVRAGTLFVCIEGFKADGHAYAAAAVNNGAGAMLVQKDVEAPEGVTVIKVKDTRYGLAFVSNVYFGNPSKRFKLIGVTGTKGKTTTTYTIKSILETAGQKVGLIGTIANFIGDRMVPTERTTPESYDLQSLFSEMADNGVDTVVMEVSSQGLELHRVSCCKFDTGIFTNLSQDHIGPGEHSSMEEYFNAKTKLFSMCEIGFVNVDSSYGAELIGKAQCKLVPYSIEISSEVRAEEIVEKPESVEYKAVTPWGSDSVKVNIPGRFSVYNSLAAIGVCRYMGVDFNEIKKGLLTVKVPGRAETVETGRDFTIIIDYAHTPDSLENILKTIKAYAKGRLVCLFGCGGDRDRTKRPMMGEISGRIADFTIITSDNPRTEDPESIVRDIEAGIKRTDGSYTVIVDRTDAIRYSIENALENDIIVLAGKGHETYQIFRDKTIHYDEREVVRDILGG